MEQFLTRFQFAISIIKLGLRSRFYIGRPFVITFQCALGEIQGAYQIKVTTTALALLLLTRHPELGNVSVQGYLIKVVLDFAIFMLCHLF